MKPVTQPTEPFFHYTHLNDQEMKDPLSVIHDFCAWSDLQPIRELMWEWLMVALSAANTNYEDAQNRWELLFLYQRLQTLLEATYLIAHRGGSSFESGNGLTIF